MGICRSTNRNNQKKSVQKIENELGPKSTSPERRRQRLYSENVRSTTRLEPIKPTATYYEDICQAKQIPIQRRESYDYCNEFRNNGRMHNRLNLLVHLANSLSRNLSFQERQPQSEETLPEYIIDWVYVENAETQLGVWKEKGKIKLTKELLESTRKAPLEEIQNSPHYYIKRIWLYHYINQYLIEKKNDNPLLIVSRKNILEESYNQFMTTKDLNLKCPIQIHFIDEVAHDAGGVYREWYCCLFNEFFKEKNKIFIPNPYNTVSKSTYLIYPKFDGQDMGYYEFFGKLIAKAIVDKTSINENLNKVIIKILLGHRIVLEDMKYYDMDIYTSLNSIKNVNNNEQLSEFNFTWEERDHLGNVKEVELIPNGRNIPLTTENKNDFVVKVVDHLTNNRCHSQINLIRKGVTSLIPENVLKAFTVEEFEFLLLGQQKIDLEDWKKNTIYKGKYNPEDPTIKMFWEVLGELSTSDLMTFFQFCTGASHAPLDGFCALKGVNNKVQKFSISESAKLDNNRLIEAKTCFNRIYLPEYKTKEKMKKAIMTIIENDTNYFGLE